jgi:hypothetical protein
MAKRKRNPKNPSSLIFWNDLENDDQLKTCSLAAQGLWACRLLPIAARSADVGVIQIGSHPCRWDEDLPVLMARAVGATPEIVEAIAMGYRSLLTELVNSGAASVDEKGRVYNRRMVREEEKRQAKIRAGRSGGKASGGSRRSKQTPKQEVSTGVSTEGSKAESTEGSRTEPPTSPVSAGSEKEISGSAPPKTKQTASTDRSTPPSKSEPSSCFSLRASKKEITNTGVVTTAGHAAEAGGRDSGPPDGEAKPGKAKASSRGTRIPADWRPTPELEQFARDRGLDPAEVALEFRTYWAARPDRGALKLDWDLTFKNQCIKLSGRLHSSRPQSVALRRGHQQPGEHELFAHGAMSAADGRPRKGILG